MKGEYLGSGVLHHRQSGETPLPVQPRAKPKHNLIDLLVSEHQKQLAANTQGIDYRKVLSKRSWPFYAFAKAIARLLGKEEGLSSFTAEELEALKKFYNQNHGLTEPELTRAFPGPRTSHFPISFMS